MSFCRPGTYFSGAAGTDESLNDQVATGVQLASLMSNDSILEDILRSVREQATSKPDALPSGLEKLSDHSLLHSYESIRRELDADRTLGLRYRLVGDTAKQRAETLRAEMIRRGLRFNPIVWP